MGDNRQFLKEGESISLGQISYRIESVEGFGGSAVVYHASYGDLLNTGFRHHVLIKELFPRDAEGGIYRDRDGRICCTEKGAVIMGEHRQGFYRGNQANLMLLEQSPEHISGNINSCEAYGTFYSVLPFHGGRSLQSVLDDGGRVKTIRESAQKIAQILDALACFHKNGILHLDISPDNILLLPKQALLIDYNSVWIVSGRESGAPAYFSEKEGYTAPEVWLREVRHIGPATDIYSVCAVWFHMLAKRRLTDDEIIKNRIAEALSEVLENFSGEYATVTSKTMQILTRGLHVLSRKRYQSAKEMREQIDELIRRIDGKGISQDAIWEGSVRSFRTLNDAPESYIARAVSAGDGQVFHQDSCKEQLKNGEKLLLKGAGGMGKTLFLLELCKNALEHYDPSAPVAVYIPLMDYQSAGKEGRFIQKYLLKHLCLEKEGGMEEALQELGRQLDSPEGLKLILLLDGLNEAGNARKWLLSEIELLGRKPSVGIVVTDRSDSVKEYGLYDFRVIELLPLSGEDVKRELAKDSLACPPQAGLQKLLGSPMMLSLYRRTMKNSVKSGLENEMKDMDQDRLIGMYFESLCVSLQRAHAGNQAKQLCHKYILYHFLPAAAGQMRRAKKSILTVEELYALAEKNYRLLQDRAFGMAFPEYLGKSRIILEGIKNGMEWFDYAVSEQLSGNLNLLRQSQEGNYFLAHENFTDYLCRRAKEERHKIHVQRRKANGRKVCAASALVLALGGAGFGIWRAKNSSNLSREEQYLLKEALYQTAGNLAALGTQIDVQMRVLDRALQREVLEGDPDAAAEFMEYAAYITEDASNYSFGRSKNEKLFDELESPGTDVPVLILRDLFGKTYEMDILMEEGMEHLKQGILRDVLLYTEKEKLAASYKACLEAYADAAYRELNLVLASLDGDMAAEVLEITGRAAVFKEYIRACPFEGKSEEVLKIELSTARSHLTECINEMKAQGYDIHITDWQ